MIDRLTQVLARARRDGKRFAVLFADIDDFKGVNDTFGHVAGDELLRVLAARLRGALRASDTVARIGGDEFVIVVEGRRARAPRRSPRPSAGRPMSMWRSAVGRCR
jgi:diguanylate cyclase (GGDEF)-like protein